MCKLEVPDQIRPFVCVDIRSIVEQRSSLDPELLRFWEPPPPDVHERQRRSGARGRNHPQSGVR